MYSVQKYRKDEVRLTDEDKIIIELVISDGYALVSCYTRVFCIPRNTEYHLDDLCTTVHTRHPGMIPLE